MPVKIYPAIKALPSEDIFFIGVVIDNPDETKAELISDFGGTELQPIVPTTKTNIATLRDPSGILVRLFPNSKSHLIIKRNGENVTIRDTMDRPETVIWKGGGFLKKDLSH